MSTLVAAAPLLELPRAEPRRRRARTDADPVDPTSLRVIVQRAQAGDVDAQRELIVSYQRRVAGFVFAITGKSHEVEDMCQRIFIRMVAAIAQLRETSQFEAWLFRLARHQCIDQLRRDKLRRFCTPFLAQHAEVPEPPGCVDSEELDALRYALSQLTEAERALLALMQEGRSYKEISAILSINMAAAKARVHRARVRLREHYQARR
jgi:RNA polymerase sigma-70 factor (ECF subfamily)